MIRKVISGALLVTGTTVGAGMLGIPLLTAQAGFWPAIWVSILAWIVFLWTGLLFLEVTLWMPVGSNLLSMTQRFMGRGGRLFAGVMFLFLYNCLLVAYYSAGAPLLLEAIEFAFGIRLGITWGFILFGGLFGLIVALGARLIDRTNFILFFGLLFAYLFLMGLGVPHIKTDHFALANWPKALFAMPILFSAFGYHNIIPSLVTYFGKERRPLRLAIWIGTTLSLIIYLIWQWIVIGIIPKELIDFTLAQGRPVTAALHYSTGLKWIFFSGQAFAFFALITSLLGVTFSMVDFLADGLKVSRKGGSRIGLTAMTFLPPMFFAMSYPRLFDTALGLAGGVGEAILNGLIPIGLIWIGKYSRQLEVGSSYLTKRWTLAMGACLIVFVMIIEIISLL